MGPLSAVAVAAGLAMIGAVADKWITMSTALYAWLLVIFAVVILLDAFYFGTGARWTTYRTNRRGQTVA